MKRFKEKIILFPEQEVETKLLYLISVGFWFPTKTTQGTEIKYWGGRRKTIKQDDEHISGIIKHIRTNKYDEHILELLKRAKKIEKMKRFKQSKINNSKLRSVFGLMNLHPVGFWFPIETRLGIEINYWGDRASRKETKIYDENVSYFLKCAGKPK